MRRLFYYLLIFGFLPLLFSCNSKSGSETDKSETETEEISAEKEDAVRSLFSDEPSDSVSISAEEITEEAFDKSLPTVIDFSAVWCGPCRRMKPVFEELKEVYDGLVNFRTIDIDEHPELAGKYGVEAVPTFVFLDKNGVERSRQVGAIPRAELEQEINNLMK